MKFSQKAAEIFYPTGQRTISDTTHLCIGAHQDDIEIMAYGAIAECYGDPNKHFSGVVLTDGGGSPRSGVYESFTDEDMKKIRATEQKTAATIGRYLCQVLMAHPSSAVKDSSNTNIKNELIELFTEMRPTVVLTHNLADKHDTHLATALHVIRALRELPKELRPKQLIAMEVWRGLDWLSDEAKIAADTSKYPNVSAALLGVFDSQISGGKRYDLASDGRRLSNATFFASHSVDELTSCSFGMDMTKLMCESTPADFISFYLDEFKKDVLDRIGKFV